MLFRSHETQELIPPKEGGHWNQSGRKFQERYKSGKISGGGWEVSEAQDQKCRKFFKRCKSGVISVGGGRGVGRTKAGENLEIDVAPV